MKIDKYGSILLSEDEAFSAIYSGKLSTFDNIFLDKNTTEQYNWAINRNKDSLPKILEYKVLDIDTDTFDKLNQKYWFMPDNYCPNLIELIYNKCTTKEETERVSEELELFIQHGMLDLLFYLKYLVDTMRENNIVWGVGRGSSVASFVLYLIGIHKVNSLKYNLDIKEFLK